MITFTIPGRPVPKARPRVALRGKGAYVYTDPATKAYEEHVGLSYREQYAMRFKGPVELWITVYFRHGRTPDLSNCIKSIEDGLNGIAYDDDRQVRRIFADMKFVKSRDEERAEVEIREYRRLQALVEDVGHLLERLKRLIQSSEKEDAA